MNGNNLRLAEDLVVSYVAEDDEVRCKRTLVQSYQHFMSSFCPDILSPKSYKSQSVIREKLSKALSYEKRHA